MKEYTVYLTEVAETDVIEICDYVSLHDSPRKADDLLGNIKETCLGLSEIPSRGHIPPELERISVFDFREIHFKPYRIIYQVLGTEIYIYCVLDGRRDLQELLQRRLLR